MNSNDYSINDSKYDMIRRTADKYGADVLEKELMKNHTSFRIGGACDIMVKINCVPLLCELIKICRESKVKYYIVGRGSNILVSDKGLHGVVLLLGQDFSDIKADGETIECSAGASLSAVCRCALDNSLTGLEFAYGIPGSVGGALYMNAGAYGGEMKDVVLSCKYIDECGEVCEMRTDEMDLSYRHSTFSERGYCIISVVFGLAKGDKTQINSRMEELMQRRRDKQPLEYPSAGSTFKRPQGDFAARLIEVCGLKGTACGGAEVSTKHSGFVINRDNADFEDVMNVVQTVKDKVKSVTGVTLECEIVIME